MFLATAATLRSQRRKEPRQPIIRWTGARDSALFKRKTWRWPSLIAAPGQLSQTLCAFTYLSGYFGLVAGASLIVCISNQVVVACSGSHVDVTIDRNHSIVNFYGAVAVLILAAIIALSLIIGRLGILAILLALVVGFLHPMLRYGGGGDCGQGFVTLAKYVTMGLGAVLLLQGK
jgi:hypothetical protein